MLRCYALKETAAYWMYDSGGLSCPNEAYIQYVDVSFTAYELIRFPHSL